MKSPTRLLRRCFPPNRDYLENPALLMLETCRMGHHGRANSETVSQHMAAAKYNRSINE